MPEVRRWQVEAFPPTAHCPHGAPCCTTAPLPCTRARVLQSHRLPSYSCVQPRDYKVDVYELANRVRQHKFKPLIVDAVPRPCEKWAAVIEFSREYFGQEPAVHPPLGYPRCPSSYPAW